MLALEERVSPEVIDCAVLGCGHKPGSRIVRDARLRPLFERSDESILREILGDAYIAHNSRETGDESRRLDPPYRVNRTMCISSHC